MATFGAGAFSSDGARDFLAELADQHPERRAAALERMFLTVRERPELRGREVFPDEVVAAAAIVAAALPGGQQFGERLHTLVADDLAPDARLTAPAPAPELANVAYEALLFVAGPQGPRHQGWTNEPDTIAALSQV